MHNIKCDPLDLLSNLKIIIVTNDIDAVSQNFEIILDYIWKGDNFSKINDILDFVKPKFTMIRKNPFCF